MGRHDEAVARWGTAREQGTAARASGRTAPTVFALTLAGVAVGLGLEAVSGQGRIINPFLPVTVASAVLNGVLGGLVSRRHAGHPVARVLQAVGLVAAAVVLMGGYANAALFGPLPGEGATAALWASRWLWVPMLVLQTTGLLLAFPDGRLPSPRWRPAAWFAVLAPTPYVVAAMGTPFADSVWGDVPVTNPLAGPLSGIAAVVEPGATLLVVASVAVAAAALLTRFRRADGDRRARVALVVGPAVCEPVVLAFSLLGIGGTWAGVAEMAVGVALAVTVTVAMLRHRMFDLDVVVNRALVSGLLVAALLGAYVAVVVLVSELVGDRVSWLPGAVAAGVVAVSFGPLLHRLRRGLDLMLFGQRHAPGSLVTRLAALDPARGASGALRAAAESLRDGLRVPWVEVTVDGTAVLAGARRTTGREVALVHGDARVGTLTVGARYDGERPSRQDARVVDAAAAQLAVTAYALGLADSLARTRERLVAAREEERRRVRRDLHDGLGPTLAGLSLGLEGAEQLAGDDGDALAGLLPVLRGQAQTALLEVRRVVDGLRPPALDELGLAGAVRHEVALLAEGTRVAFSVCCDGVSGRLPAATEVAALRIVMEAAANVCRHAHAASCAVTLVQQGQDLHVVVADDGRGIAADARHHVGLDSMRERAAEVGGRLSVTSEPGRGATVTAVLPGALPGGPS